MQTKSMVSYYQENNFNPVPIALNTSSAWESHFLKRRNLYERHLGIPFSLLSGRSVIEFGPNSGENALVLASLGANMTLVEPNEQSLPRLESLFRQFGLEKQLTLIHQGIESFEADKLYDVVLAEGFLYTLPNRDQLVQMMGQLLVPGGMAVISFIDRYGSLIELTRRLFLWRACQLVDVDDIGDETCLALATRLFGDDFAQLNASRPFFAWWKDNLVSPFLLSSCLWSYQELLPLIELGGCELQATSPKWATLDHFDWYKNISPSKQRHQKFLDSWAKTLPFFLTGTLPSNGSIAPASAEVVTALSELIDQISVYTTNLNGSIEAVSYPAVLDDYFKQSNDDGLITFNQKMKQLYEALYTDQLETLISTYHQTTSLRKLWGSPYQYLSFSKKFEAVNYYPQNNR